MRTRQFVFVILALGIVSVAELSVIVTTISPRAATEETYWVFFLSLFLALTSVGSLAWYILKRYLIYRSSSVRLWPSLRQSALFSLITVLSLFFNSLGILSFWDIIPLIIAAILIEFFFQADKSHPTSSDRETE